MAKKNEKMSEETKRKIGLANKGHKVTIETRKKLSEYSKAYPSKSFLGHRHTDVSKKKMRDKLKGRTPWNKGTGIKKNLIKSIKNCLKYKQWRSNIFQRDSWTCQTCGLRGRELNAHHIKRFSNILNENNITTLEQAENCEELWSIDNGTTLCVECHKLTDGYAKNIG